ncbi:MAG: hypothetical protein LBQ12_10225 [Deltaproteobacteria bacterium]|jgi:hypothetical protein|nr:hypothetical protein [Deltaproteobacteria bacterium]
MRHATVSIAVAALALSGAALFQAGPASAGDAPAAEWIKFFGGETMSSISSVAPTADGGLVAAGLSLPKGAQAEGYGSPYDVSLMKLGAGGAVEFASALISMNDSLNRDASVAVTSDGGYVVAGTVAEPKIDLKGLALGGDDAFVARLDPSGKTLWLKTYGGSDYDKASSVVEGPDGGFLLTGATRSREAGTGCGFDRLEFAPWAALLDSDGNLVGASCRGFGFDAKNAFSAWAPGRDAVFVAGDTGAGSATNVVAGTFGPGPQFKGFRRILGDGGSWNVTGVLGLGDGGLAAAGFRQDVLSDDSGKHRGFLAAFGPDLELLWQRQLEKWPVSYLFSLSGTKGGYVAAGAYVTAANLRDYVFDAFVVLADAEGNAYSELALSGSGADSATAAAELSGGGMAVAGYTESLDGDFSSRKGKVLPGDEGRRGAFVMRLPAPAPPGR